MKAGKVKSCGCLRRDGKTKPLFRDLTGMTFSKLTVTKYLGNGKWLCDCECGGTRIASAESLLSGTVLSCGCFKKVTKRNRPHEDLTGMVFGRLTVIRYIGESKWLCNCSCGNSVEADTHRLKSGSIRSCGCLHREVARKSATKHGDSKTRLYVIWRGMKQRCFNENNPSYKFYGARGITVCDEWASSYQTFKEWALTNGYSNDLTIDRIDCNGNYCPNNCRWVDWEVQFKNRRPTHYIGPKKKVEQLDESGNVIARFESEDAAAESIGVSPNSISQVVTGARKSTKGTFWRYAQEG